MSEQPDLEIGKCSDIFFDGDTIVKTSKQVMPLDEAETTRASLTEYAAFLADEPIEVAELRSTSLVHAHDGYRVRHASDVVYGPSVLSLRGEERQLAIAKATSGILAMSVAGDANRLAVGLDATAKNWHVNTVGAPVLVDTYPPLLRDASGAMNVGANPSNYPHYEHYMGTKSGVVTKLLFSAHNDNYPTLSVRDCIRQAVHGAEDWSYDALPASMDPYIKDKVRAELRLRFLPFLGSTASRMVRDKIAR